MSPNKPPSTLDKIFSVERRIHTLKGDLQGLFEKYVTDLLFLRELRERLGSEMVDDAFPPSDRTPMLAEDIDDEKTFDQIPYDRLQLQRKENGDYGSVEYVYQGLLGVYKLRIGTSITDDEKVFYVYFDDKMFVNLYPTRVPKVLVGKDDEGEFYIFRFNGKDVDVFKREYEF